MYRIMAYKFWWLSPEEYWEENYDDAEILAQDLEKQGMSVDIEYIDEGE